MLIHTTAGDLLLAEDSSAHELSNITLLNEILSILHMEHFAEHQERHTSIAIPIANAPPVEASQIWAMAEEGVPIQVVEPSGEEVMLVSSMEVPVVAEAKVMEVELSEMASDQM